MKKFFFGLNFTFVLLLLTSVEGAFGSTFCTCEDRDNDGRFGVVLHENGQQTVIRPNHGTYYDCGSLKSSLNQCADAGGLCACEDRDNDGRFGVVLYQKAQGQVLRPNLGTYYNCVSAAPNLPECSQNSNYCACEDRDNDGRFGVVLYGSMSGRVVHANYGTFYACTSFKSSIGDCQQNTNYCGCEDRDQDGRFGVVLYEGVLQEGSNVLRANQGTYYQCTSIMSGLAQCQ